MSEPEDANITFAFHPAPHQQHDQYQLGNMTTRIGSGAQFALDQVGLQVVKCLQPHHYSNYYPLRLPQRPHEDEDELILLTNLQGSLLFPKTEFFIKGDI